jgi:hypothetical protein
LGTNDTRIGCPNAPAEPALGQSKGLKSPPDAANVMDHPVPICPDCSGKLKPALAIGRFIERPDIRILMCEQCRHLHWFAIEGGALRKL